MIQSDITLSNLGIRLHNDKLITQKQLYNAIARQKIRGGYLSHHLIELGYIGEIDLTAYISCHYGYPYLPLDNYAVTNNTSDAIDIETMRTFYVLPIEKYNDLLIVVMADPLNKGVLELLKNKTKCKIVIFVSTKGEIEKTFKQISSIDMQYPKSESADEDLLKDDPVYCKKKEGQVKQQSRRHFKRISLHAIAESYSQPKFSARIINVSLNGVLFHCETSLMKGMQIPVNIHLQKNNVILGVIEIIRAKPLPGQTGIKQTIYEIGATFNFMSHNDLKKLAGFLFERIRKQNQKYSLEKNNENTETIS